ncbi:DUF2272 domain-containing protein [Luteimonas yindakuii]|uniref:DUF2272 domain-containing protein n=1 Tax=Luteimonas yindakuii TaxID=2565782 RepID=UPI0011078946|nr:DUF2272 domain-containing protein [Luteimonas yindakuii]QCO67654.2 DUF2272 domain-containing protein [Luteimonas yindakuii]
MPLCLRVSVLRWVALLLLVPGVAPAADPCPLLRGEVDAADVATRIAAVACEEHQLWHRPFIDADGRLAGSVVREAEAALLANGEQAWRRVAGYWRDSGLLAAAAGRPGAAECAYAGIDGHPSPACRAFVVDTPWSAAYVSWVMRRAGLRGFNGSASHVSYVRDAYRGPDASAYRVAAPESARPKRGDLLCYARASTRTFGFAGLAQLLATSDEGLGMHCDIVVDARPHTGLAWLVGGNVFDGVTLRMLPLTPGGLLHELPVRQLSDPPCSPDHPQACSANRQDWTVLLELRPPDVLAGLAPPPPLQVTHAASIVLPAQPPGTPDGCCIHCIAGDTRVPRCPRDAGGSGGD